MAISLAIARYQTPGNRLKGLLNSIWTFAVFVEIPVHCDFSEIRNLTKINIQ